MSYVVFARKYRPQVFDDVIGQSHVTTTLKNAISQDRVAHAYLFAGPRGVGKTTTARLLAKAINCEKGPTINPCNACASCKEIQSGSSLDILEIDGASNRGIDEIRNLRDNVKFSPTKGKFKVYIIDEVHMLTPEAFNALLKTLEEPPAHVKFIFATTQAYKVPPTILSRCQRFDFKRMTSADILANLKKITKSEKLDASEEALILVARHSDGAMRDAQVLLDQLISFTKGGITPDDVTKMLGLVSDDILFELAGHIKDKNASAALSMVDSFFSEGKDVFQVVLGLITHFRNIAVTKISKDAASILDYTKEKLEKYRSVAGQFTIEEILYNIYTLSNTLDFIRKSGMSRVPLEAAVIKLSRAGSIASLENIMEKIDALANSAPASRDLISETHVAPGAGMAQRSAESSKSQTPSRPAKAENKHQEAGGSSSKMESSTDLDEMLSAWSGVVNHIMPKKISIAHYLQEGYPVAINGRTVVIGFPKELKFHKEVLEGTDNRKMIEEAIRAKLNLEVKVEFRLEESSAKAAGSPVDGAAGAEDEVLEMETKSDSDPIVNTALEMFGGEISAEARMKRKVK